MPIPDYIQGSVSDTSVTKTDDGGAIATPKKWYVAVVQTNCERMVEEFLKKMGIEAFVATQMDTTLRKGKRKEVERIVVRSRVFVQVAPDSKSRTEVKKVLYVKRFVPYPGTYTDAVIPDEQIKMFKYMLRYSDEAVVVTDNVRVGRKIRVARGNFTGLTGCICEVGSKKHTCIGVHMDLLGFACVRINVADVEFLD